MTRDAEPERPDRSDESLLEEALLLAAGLAETPPADSADEESPELPEEILGLLDGTASPEEAERARARLADDPRLAREFGRVASSLARLEESPVSVEAPAELYAEALALGDRTAVREEAGSPAAAGEGTSIWEALRRLFAGARAPLFAAGAAAVLLVTFVVRDSGRHEPASGEYRAVPETPGPVERRSPEDGAILSSDTLFEWTEVDGATRYRVILVDPRGGEMLELGPTTGTSLVASGDRLEEAFAGSSREILWTVRALLLDGTETSSSPGELRWEGESP
jgi:hypothetical protein